MTDDKRLYNSVAPLRNVAALVTLVEKVRSRAIGLPGMAVFYGPSGYGKTTASVYAANRFQAYSVQVKSAWKQRLFCEAILHEMGLKPRGTIGHMVQQISEHLARTDAPLLIDEVDFLVTQRSIEIVRDIYEGSGAPVILIGEELLPQKLREWERVHGRILDWVAAEPGSIDDVQHLAPIYAAGVDVGDDLAAAILAKSGGSIRRICVSLANAAEFALVRGLSRLGARDLPEKNLFTGEAPRPRRVA